MIEENITRRFLCFMGYNLTIVDGVYTPTYNLGA